MSELHPDDQQRMIQAVDQVNIDSITREIFRTNLGNVVTTTIKLTDGAGTITLKYVDL